MTAPEQNYSPIERAPTFLKHEENRSGVACYKDAYSGGKADFSPRSQDNICPRPNQQALEITPPPYSGGDKATTGDHNALADPKSRPEDRIKAIYEMARNRSKQISFANDSRKYDIEIEAVPNSAKKMVHLYAKGDDGKEHVVMRGVVNGDGSVQQEQDARGLKVSYGGDRWPQSAYLFEAAAKSEKPHKQEKPSKHEAAQQEQPPLKALALKQEQEKNPEQLNKQPEQTPDLLSDASKFMNKLVETAEQMLRNGIQTIGWCAGGVRKALNKTGFQIDPGRPATELGDYLHKTGNFDKIPLTDLHGEPPKGAILVRNWNGNVVKAHGRNIGHIAIVGHNGTEYSDHIAHTKPDGGLYRNSYVLIPKGYYNNPNT